jgi:hypothetical protein
MNTTKTVIGEHDVVVLRNPVRGFPAGTRGAVVSMFPSHRWVEVVDESNDWEYGVISVPTDELELVWKNPRTTPEIAAD